MLYFLIQVTEESNKPAIPIKAIAFNLLKLKSKVIRGRSHGHGGHVCCSSVSLADSWEVTENKQSAGSLVHSTHSFHPLLAGMQAAFLSHCVSAHTCLLLFPVCPDLISICIKVSVTTFLTWVFLLLGVTFPSPVFTKNNSLYHHKVKDF